MSSRTQGTSNTLSCGNEFSALRKSLIKAAKKLDWNLVPRCGDDRLSSGRRRGCETRGRIRVLAA